MAGGVDNLEVRGYSGLTEVGDKKLRTDPPPDTVQQRYEI